MTKGKLVSTRSDHCAIIEAHNCGVPIDELCERFNLKRPTISRIIRNYEQSGLCLVVKSAAKTQTSRTSRTKLTTDQLLKMLYYYNSSSRSYSDLVKFIFVTFGVTVSKASVGHYLQRARNLLNESGPIDFESTQSCQSAEDDEQIHDLTLPGSSESSSSPPSTTTPTNNISTTDTNTDEVSPSMVESLMEASMLTPEDTESELSYYFEF